LENKESTLKPPTEPVVIRHESKKRIPPAPSPVELAEPIEIPVKSPPTPPEMEDEIPELSVEAPISIEIRQTIVSPTDTEKSPRDSQETTSDEASSIEPLSPSTTALTEILPEVDSVESVLSFDSEIEIPTVPFFVNVIENPFERYQVVVCVSSH
jgi:hypothetical protein